MRRLARILRAHACRSLPLLLVLLCAGGVVAEAAHGQSRNPRLQLGFAEHSYPASMPDAFWADARTLGVSTLRWDLHWDRIAPERPQRPCRHTDPAYRWDETDSFVRGAERAGLAQGVMFTVWRTPPWASALRRSGGKPQEMPRLNEWRCFVEAATQRYSGRYTPPGSATPLPRIGAWEAWNEPNLIFAFTPQRVGSKNVSIRNYVRLLNTMHRVVKKNHGRRSLVVGGSLYKQSSRQGVNPIVFMRGMQRHQARFDVLSVHPYNNIQARGLRDGRGQSRRTPRTITVGNIETFIALSNQTFKKRYPIWVTEWAWQTQGEGYDPRYGVSEQQQALFLRQSIRKLARYRQIERAMWFLLRDDPPCTRPCQTPWTSDLRSYDNRAKPAYDAWAAERARLR
jgi:hypothetical protein